MSCNVAPFNMTGVLQLVYEHFITKIAKKQTLYKYGNGFEWIFGDVNRSKVKIRK